MRPKPRVSFSHKLERDGIHDFFNQNVDGILWKIFYCQCFLSIFVESLPECVTPNWSSFSKHQFLADSFSTNFAFSFSMSFYMSLACNWTKIFFQSMFKRRGDSFTQTLDIHKKWTKLNVQLSKKKNSGELQIGFFFFFPNLTIRFRRNISRSLCVEAHMKHIKILILTLWQLFSKAIRLPTMIWNYNLKSQCTGLCENDIIFESERKNC